jgi:hypothetical protein
MPNQEVLLFLICLFLKVNTSHMIHLHATRKVLNLGKIDGKTMITLQPEDQELQNWYVTIMGSSFRGKMLVYIYMNHP